jgi:hypothetical protein
LVLVGYWLLNESSKDLDNPTAKDHSGNENHGTINDGGDSTVPGANGILGQNAYSFDGNNDYVGIPDQDYLDVTQTQSVSVSFWVKPQNSSSMPVVKRDSNAGWEAQLSGDHIGFYLTDGSNSATESGDIAAPSTNKWNMLTIVFDRDEERVAMYLNGKQTGDYIDISHIGDTSNNLPISIGGRQLRGDAWISGFISEVRIYNHALTPQEVQYLYSVGQRGRQVSSGKSS